MDATRKPAKSAFLRASTKTLPTGLDPRLNAIIDASPLLSKDAEVSLTNSITRAVVACWQSCATAFVRESTRSAMLNVAVAALPKRKVDAADGDDDADDNASDAADAAPFALAQQSSTANTIAALRVRDLDWFALRAAQAHTLGALSDTIGNPRASATTIARATEARRAVLSAAAHLERLVDRMTRANLRLVLTVASKQRPGLPFADLVQEGSTGLLKAIRRFDPSRGLRFSTFAVHWIRADLGRANANTGALIRRPVHIINIVGAALRTQDELREKLGRTPTVAEVAKVIKRNVETTAAALDPTRTLSTETPLRGSDHGESTGTLGDIIPDPNPHDWTCDTISMEEHAIIRAGIARLAEREQSIIRRRFGISSDDGTQTEPEKLIEIGDDLGMSRERIRQIESTAIKTLRYTIPPIRRNRNERREVVAL
ncbi:MAG: sigma-70 family RNA polymerase sigma factor [Polaromonas sp.]|nr:sigma-70 family RNA polymerase sigma factor [Polaromonas sp.]